MSGTQSEAQLEADLVKRLTSLGYATATHSAIGVKIAPLTEQLERMQDFEKGLLQKMFV